MSSEAPPPAGLFASFVPFLPTYSHLLFAALLPIYTGAHASLRRPLNTLSPKEVRALRPARSPAGVDSDDDDDLSDDGEDGENESPAPENLSAFDAAMFPVTAAAVLGGLYLLIKYLDDPTLLSRVLTWYFCGMGVFAVGRNFADALGLAVGFVFPAQYRDAQGNLVKAGFDSWSVQGAPGKAIPSPFPSAPPLPQAMHPAVWALRRKLRARWLVDVKCMGEVLRKSFWIGDFLGPAVGLVVVAAYALGGKHWLLTNTMGISFSYGAMQLMSPTTFPIATLLLGLLFAYDIFFVFYTPLMVTVATNLDVPIKLLFPRPGKTESGSPALAMLGLGDVVLPGILIAMALRWDLWRFYEVQRRNLVEAAKLAKAADHQQLAKAEEKSLKPRYSKASGCWGLRFWDPRATAGDFPKTYFTASIVGYVVGMLTTLAVMHVFQHAQPALLYLVPGVLGSVWGTAFVRGETKAMWNYTEEEQLDEAEKEKKETEEKAAAAAAAAKETVRGEVDQTILTVKITRRPAVEARREQPLPTAADGDDGGAVRATEESSESEYNDDDSHDNGNDNNDHDDVHDVHDEEEEDGSTSSEEVVVEDPKNSMWGTTIIDQTG